LKHVEIDRTVVEELLLPHKEGIIAGTPTMPPTMVTTVTSESQEVVIRLDLTKVRRED